VAFADEKIKVTQTTGKELFDPDKPAGAEVEAASVLQLAAIWARRAGINTDSLESSLSALTLALAERHTELIAGQTALADRVKAVEDWFAKLGDPGSVEQKVALLHAVLGPQSRAVGLALADFED
jgi:hypothetical protein